jgi:hypothetical protein
MNKYVIAVNHGGSSEIILEEVEATSELKALQDYFEDTSYTSADSMIDDYYDKSETIINLIKLNHARAGRSGSGLQPQLAQFDSVARVQ